jgi:hypothetical protein
MLQLWIKWFRSRSSRGTSLSLYVLWRPAGLWTMTLALYDEGA